MYTDENVPPKGKNVTVSIQVQVHAVYIICIAVNYLPTMMLLLLEIGDCQYSLTSNSVLQRARNIQKQNRQSSPWWAGSVHSKGWMTSESIVTLLLGKLNEECTYLRKKTHSSPFRMIAVNRLVLFNWENMVADLQINAPSCSKFCTASPPETTTGTK